MALDGFLILWQDKHLQNMTVVQHYTVIALLLTNSDVLGICIPDKGFWVFVNIS